MQHQYHHGVVILNHDDDGDKNTTRTTRTTSTSKAPSCGRIVHNFGSSCCSVVQPIVLSGSSSSSLLLFVNKLRLLLVVLLLITLTSITGAVAATINVVGKTAATAEKSNHNNPIQGGVHNDENDDSMHPQQQQQQRSTRLYHRLQQPKRTRRRRTRGGRRILLLQKPQPPQLNVDSSSTTTTSTSSLLIEVQNGNNINYNNNSDRGNTSSSTPLIISTTLSNNTLAVVAGGGEVENNNNNNRTKKDTDDCTESCCMQLLLSSTATTTATTGEQQTQQPLPPPQEQQNSRKQQQEQQQQPCPTCPTCATTDATSGNPLAFLPTSVQYVLILVLITISAVFSGLTLGVLSLDKTGLEVIMDSEDAVSAAYARRIYPVRKNGNLLLCTLLLGNTSANALLSILIADKFGGLIGVVSSTMLILIFGEIIPQAICNRYALYIGSRAVPMVLVIIVIFYPLAKPLALILDCVLGEELATTYSAKEMTKLLQIHVAENALDQETAQSMTGALQYKNVPVRDVMTPIDNVFMLPTHTHLNFETMAQIFQTGYSRIPVYEVNKNNVVGLLFVKDLIFVDPEDGTLLSDFIDIFGRGVHVVWPDDTLGDVLRELKHGRSHIALVRDVNHMDDNHDPYYEVRGIITLEDIIEEILGHEIVDETDAYLDGSHSVRLDRADAIKFARLRLLDSKIVDEKLSYDETRAVAAHLWKNYNDVVAFLTENQLHRLIAETPVSVLPTATEELGSPLPNDLMYEKGVSSEVCTLILSGKVTVLVGADGFRSDVSSWSLLAVGAWNVPDYVPDFSAYVSSGPCRCIRITRGRFAAAVDASALERQTTTTTTTTVVASPTTTTSAAAAAITTTTTSAASVLGPIVPTAVHDQLPSSSSPPPTELTDTTGDVTSRKAKLLSALRIFENDNNASNSMAPSSSTLRPRRTVSFADSETLRRANSSSRRSSAQQQQRATGIRATSLLSSISSTPFPPTPPSAVAQAQSNRFGFISSPDVSENRDDEK